MLREIYKALEKPQSSKYGVIVQKFILINILINIFVILSSLLFTFKSDVVVVLNAIENITVFIFVVELLFRYISIGYDERYSGLKGKIAFTFTPYILIDILTLIPYFITNIQGDVLLARVIRFLRFFRILKLIRLKSVLKKFFSISAFATSSIFIQVIVLFIFSVFFIGIFSFAYTGDKTSLVIFLDPPALSEATSNSEMIFGVIELMIGLFVGGALISIISELLTNITTNVKNGYHPYRDKGHIVIINQNTKLQFILKELNRYYIDLEQLQDVVIFLPKVENIEDFSQNLNKYTNLNLILLTGDVLNWNSYERININYAKKVLILKDENSNIKNLNVKITRFLLVNKHFNNQNLDFIIESQDGKSVLGVYEEIFRNVKNSYILIENNTIIQKFLNRAIIEPDYFKIYLNLLSYIDYEFYRLKSSDVFQSSISFKDAYRQFTRGILVGIIKGDKLLLNPPKETIIDLEDKLVVILKNKLEYTIDTKKMLTTNIQKIDKPHLKVSRKICIVGDFDDINQEKITNFLTNKSIDKLNNIVISDGDYMKESIWNEIVAQKYDAVILNIEDDYEFILTMYLKNLYKDNKEFINTIINIIHDPINARLISDSDNNRNIILSEELVGNYTAQVMFNHGVKDIFDEITQSNGSEFYILEKEHYKELFKMGFDDVKTNLFFSNMIYIGAIKDGKFIVDYKYIEKVQKIVVLARGI